jgi:hypothetical protein
MRTAVLVVSGRGAQVVCFNDGLLDLLTGQVVDCAALALGDRCKNGICLAHSAEEHLGVLIAGHRVHDGMRPGDVWLDWADAALNVCVVVPGHTRT